jgi:ribosomal-protein-alanine N-acetyltransferase
MQWANEPIIVQTSNQEDFEICARIMAASDPWIKLGMNHDDCLKAFEGSFKEVYVLKKQDQIIGFAVVQTQGTFKGYIQTIAISQANRGAGYGTQLLQHCERQILTYSPNIFICVSAFNEGAIQLYYRLGFKLVGELKDFVKDGFTELLLRKTVGPIVGYEGHRKNKTKHE